MKTVTITNEVFEEVVKSGETVDAILRMILEVKPSGDMITREGVIFPEGTNFLVWYKDRAYYGKVVDGKIEVMGERFDTVSAAAVKITKRPTNGWDFWKCKRPTDSDFIKISTLRTSKTRKARASK